MSKIEYMIERACAICRENKATCNPKCYVLEAREEYRLLTGERAPEPIHEPQEELDIF